MEKLLELKIPHRAGKMVCRRRRKSFLLVNFSSVGMFTVGARWYSAELRWFSVSRCNGIDSQRYFDLYSISFHLLKIIFSHWTSSLTRPSSSAYNNNFINPIQFKFIGNVNNDSFSYSPFSSLHLKRILARCFMPVIWIIFWFFAFSPSQRVEWAK